MAQEQEYIASLQNFSQSIEYLVEAIKNQVETEKVSIETALGNAKEESKQVLEIAKTLSVISEDVKDTKQNSQEILKHIRSLRRQKETGFFETLSGVKNKAKGIAEGIQTVALMASSILAIGLAFKVIGDVDFKSVLALSISLPLVAIAFNKVAETKLTPKEALSTGIAMVIMSAAVSASGYVLSTMPTLSFMQMVSAIAVSAAMGIAMYGLGEAAQQLGKGTKGIKNLYAIVPVLPFVAAGIVASGYILASMPTIGFAQFASAIGVGIAMGASMIPLALAAKFMKGNSSDILELAIMMPIIAGAIWASAYILQDVPNVDTLGVLETSFAVTAAGVIMGGGLWALSKMNISTNAIIEGALAMVIISGALMVMSHILSAGNYDSYPPVDWAKGVGMSMLVTIPAVVALGLLGATGIGFLVIGAGIAGMIMMAGALVAVGDILSGGNFSGGPSVEWARGVGLSLMTFTSALAALTPGVFGWLMGDTFDSQIQNIIKIAEALNEVGAIISTGTYTGGPSVAWAMGVGLSIKYFAEALESFKPSAWDLLMGESFDQNIAGMLKLAGMMKFLPTLLGPSSIYEGTGPTKEWAEGVGMSMKYFAQALDSFKPGAWDLLMGETFDKNIAGMLKLASMMMFLPVLLGPSSLYEGTGPTKEWAEGVGMSIKYFAEALDSFKPGAWDLLKGETFDKNIAGMLKLASMMMFLPALLGPSSLYEGTGPTKKWSEGVGAALVAIGTTVATLADEVDAEDVYEWIVPIKQLSTLIPYFANKMKGLSFDNYPSKEWSEGIFEFIRNFSEYEGSSGDVKETAYNITKLSNSYFRLARAIMSLGRSLNSIKNVPDLSNLYTGLITLSLIDNNNLMTVLDSINKKDKEFAKVVSRLKSSSASYVPPTQRITVEATMPSRDKGSKVSTQTPSAKTSVVKQDGSKTSQKVNPVYRSNELLNKIYYLIKNQIRILNEIEDNTATSKEAGFKNG